MASLTISGSTQSPRPTTREITRHALLFFITVLTTTFAGVALATTDDFTSQLNSSAPASSIELVLRLPLYYLQIVFALIAHSFAHPDLLIKGLTFSGCLLAILTAHEAGHYFACRRYGVHASLPFFIPAPPLFLAGTFGAFIKIKSPVETRRALFDIAVAGPLAGFIVILPVAFAAIITSRPQPPLPPDASVIIFNDPLLLKLIGSAFRIDSAHMEGNSFYFAAWIGLLVTSLNLIPVGQLDGGHIIYSLFGARGHRMIGRMAFVAMAVIAPLGWLWHSAPSGFLYLILLFIMLRVRGPQTLDEIESPDAKRILIALLTLIVFALCFVPFPMTLI
jgi:membrane-associated protease RseP (regulator of RpoE activity)